MPVILKKKQPILTCTYLTTYLYINKCYKIQKYLIVTVIRYYIIKTSQNNKYNNALYIEYKNYKYYMNNQNGCE